MIGRRRQSVVPGEIPDAESMLADAGGTTGRKIDNRMSEQLGSHGDGHDSVSDSDTDSENDDNVEGARKWLIARKWSVSQVAEWVSEAYSAIREKKTNERKLMSAMGVSSSAAPPPQRLLYEMRRRRMEAEPGATPQQLKASLLTKVDDELRKLEADRQTVVGILSREEIGRAHV